MHIYIDGCILVAQDKTLLYKALNELKAIFGGTDEGEVDEYLRVKVGRLKDGSLRLSQQIHLQQKTNMSIPTTATCPHCLPLRLIRIYIRTKGENT